MPQVIQKDLYAVNVIKWQLTPRHKAWLNITVLFPVFRLRQ